MGSFLRPLIVLSLFTLSACTGGISDLGDAAPDSTEPTGADLSERTPVLALAQKAAPDLPPPGEDEDDQDVVPGQLCDEAHPERTVGMRLCDPAASPGYTLFAPILGRTTYLIDLWGRRVHSWTSEFMPSNSVYLQPDGTLIRAAWSASNLSFPGGAGRGGSVESFSWEGELLWRFDYSDDDHHMHHDVEPMPGGTLMVLGWERKTREEALAAGRDPALLSDAGLWVEHLLEVEPHTGEVVWEWHLWDHLVQNLDPAADDYGDPAEHPEKLDLNVTGRNNPASPDWSHANAVAYNRALDQLVLTTARHEELWVIDHSTSSDEAATSRGGDSGRGGDFLWRWGNPANYGAGGPADRILGGPHDAHWIPEGLPGAGNLLVFNNHVEDSQASEVLELELPLNSRGTYDLLPSGRFGPEAPVWRHREPGFYSNRVSGSQRMPNGNTLICEGTPGRFFEVTPDGERVWEYQNPVTGDGPLDQGVVPERAPVFRATRLPVDYPGLGDLTPGAVIEGG